MRSSRSASACEYPADCPKGLCSRSALSVVSRSAAVFCALSRSAGSLKYSRSAAFDIVSLAAASVFPAPCANARPISTPAAVNTAAAVTHSATKRHSRIFSVIYFIALLLDFLSLLWYHVCDKDFSAVFIHSALRASSRGAFSFASVLSARPSFMSFCLLRMSFSTSMLHASNAISAST